MIQGFSSRPPANRFLILFPGRTGSSWLVEALSRHPGVRIEGEILVRRSAAEQRKAFKRLLGDGAQPGANGFKTKLKDVAEPEALRSFVQEHDVSVIHMRRGDLLRLALSRINARRLHDATGAWNVRAGMSPVDEGEVGVEELVESLSSCRRDVLALEEYVRSLGVEPHVIEYADILVSPEAVLRTTQEFIGVPFRSLESSVFKNTSENLRRAVPNLDDLRRELGSGEWASVFEIDPVSERPGSS